MTEAQQEIRRFGRNIALRWFTTLTLIRSEEPEPGLARWVFCDPAGHHFGIMLEGSEEFFGAGLAIILTEDIDHYGWSLRDPSASTVRWLLNPDYTARRDGGVRAQEAVEQSPPT